MHIEQVNTLSEFEEVTGYLHRLKPRSFTLQELYAYGRAKQHELKYDDRGRAMKDITQEEAIELAKIVGWPSMKESSVRRAIKHPETMTAKKDDWEHWCVSIGTEVVVEICSDGFLVYYVGHEHEQCSISMQATVRAWIYLRSVGIAFDLVPWHEMSAIARVVSEGGSAVKVSGDQIVKEKQKA